MKTALAPCSSIASIARRRVSANASGNYRYTVYIPRYEHWYRSMSAAMVEKKKGGDVGRGWIAIAHALSMPLGRMHLIC